MAYWSWASWMVGGCAVGFGVGWLMAKSAGFGLFVTLGAGIFGTVLAGQAGFSKAIPFLLGGAVFAGIGYAQGGGEL